MLENLNWCVFYLPSKDGSETKYFRTEDEAREFWEKKCKECPICGKDEWCDVKACEWDYCKVEDDDIIEIKKSELIKMVEKILKIF